MVVISCLMRWHGLQHPGKKDYKFWLLNCGGLLLGQKEHCTAAYSLQEGHSNCNVTSAVVSTPETRAELQHPALLEQTRPDHCTTPEVTEAEHGHRRK